MSILAPHFYAIILYGRIASFILDRWDAELDFYLILAGELEPMDIIDLLCEMYAFMAGFEGEVPGADAISCGNYLDMNLPMAKYLAKRYLDNVLGNLTEGNTVYPA